MRKKFKQFLVLCMATILLLSACATETVTPSDSEGASSSTEMESTAESTDVTMQETDTDTEAVTEPSTEAETKAPVEEPTETLPEEPTEELSETLPEEPTEEPTETLPEEPTEVPTEPETEPAPKPTVADCGNTFWNKSGTKVGQVRMDSFKHQTSQKEYAKLINKSTVWKVTVDENVGVFELRGWVGMNFSNFELAWRIGTDNEVQYRNWSVTPISREPAVLQAAQSEGYSNATGFVYYFGIDDFTSGDKLHLFMKDKDTDTVYCFCEIHVTVKASSAPTDPSINEKYELGHGSNMDMSAYDPITNHEPVLAPDDDPTVKLWFDHITEKVTRYDTSGKDSGKDSYTIQMGKNEVEGCQFFLYSPTVKKLTIKISDFENDKGETLPTELGVEYYIEDGYVTHYGYPADYVYPDAVVPYESYIAYSSNTENGRYGTNANDKIDYGPYVCVGPFSGSDWNHEKYPFRESIRGFVVQAETTKDSTPGAYKATVEIYDAETGKCIKMANVYTYVYDVTLSEETALDTAFGLWDPVSVYMHQYNENPNLHRYSDVEITQAMANFFLKHRITLTGSITYFNVMGEEWFENPRVTSLRVLTKDQYDSIKNNPVLAKKMFYYGQDEPGVPRGWRPIGWPDGTSETVYDNTGLLSVLAIAREADQLKNVWGWEDYRLLVPFERMMDFTTFNFNSVDKKTGFPAWYDQYAVNGERDSLEYLSKRVNIWAPVFTGATPKELASSMIGEQYMQSDKSDQTFGEFQDRLEQYQADGDELWNYVACQPPYTAPYQNILLFNDGTEGRSMFWTTYMLNSTGFLYWHVSYYDAAGNNTYQMRCPFSKTGPGDGILIYPGSAYGQLDPIPSIRLLNMRDGIEEYQMLTMLEACKGEAFTDELVSHIVTSTVTFTKDDNVLYNVRSFLLRALEEAN